MQLIQLRYFCAVARCQNMSRAADELWVSQPALSRAIISLEEELGTKLFERTGRNIQLNEAGKLYYTQINHVLHQLSLANQRVQELERQEKNEIRLLFSAANFICAWFWKNFQEEFPDVQLVLNDYYNPTPFNQVECDFHIYASPSIHNELESIVLLKESLLFAMGKDHPLAKKDSIQLQEAKNYQFQSLPVNENLSDNLHLACQQAGFQPEVVFCTEDSFSYFNALTSNNLLAMVPAYTAFPALDDRLILRPIIEPEVSRTIYLGWHKDRTMNELHKNFISYCQKIFAELENRNTI